MKNIIKLIITSFNDLQTDANKSRVEVDNVARELRQLVNNKHESGRHTYGAAKRGVLLEMIREHLYILRTTQIAMAYIKDGVVYINHKETPEGLHNVEELIGSGLTVQQWNELDRCEVWIKSGNIY